MEYKYCYGLGIKKLNNPSRFFRAHCLFCGESIKHCGLSEKHFTNDITEVLEFFKDENLQGVSLHNASKNESVQILKIVKNNVKYLELIFCGFEYAELENLNNVENVEILHTSKPFNLWNVKNNINLRTLNLSFHNCKEINNIENLENSTIENLKINACNPVPIKYNSIKIGSLKVLATMPNLKRAEINIVSKNDKVEELLALSTLKNIEYLKLQKGHFTFEQFAWLKSRLENIKQLNCLYDYKFDDYYNVEAGVIIGKNRSNYYLDYSKKGLDRYIASYNNLVQKYKTLETPPNNYK